MLTVFWVETIFLIFFAFSFTVQWVLSWRQSSAVAAHRHQVPQDFATTISLEEHQKAADYTLAKERFSRYSMIFQAAFLLWFTVGGGLAFLAEITHGISGHPLMRGILLIVLLILVQWFIGLPFALYKTFRLEERFGFNRTTIKTFIADQIKSGVLMAVLGIPLISLVLYLMEAMGKNWWLYVWLVWVAFSLTMMVVFPRWIAPLFNQFQPLEDEVLQNKINNLLQKTGFESKGVFVMDGSKRSGHGNAYFTGLGKQKRIVFFDTLLKTLNHEETEAVLAHELGHFKHKHILRQMIFSFSLGLILLMILGWLMPQRAFYVGLGALYASPAMALILFFMVLPLFLLVFAPLSSMLSRRHEYQADAFAAQNTHPEHLISALTKLYRDNAGTLVTDKWYSYFYDSHPDANARVRALRKNMS